MRLLYPLFGTSTTLMLADGRFALILQTLIPSSRARRLFMGRLLTLEKLGNNGVNEGVIDVVTTICLLELSEGLSRAEMSTLPSSGRYQEVLHLLQGRQQWMQSVIRLRQCHLIN